VRGVPKTPAAPCPTSPKPETLVRSPPSIFAIAATQSPSRPPGEPQRGEESLSAARRRFRASSQPRALAVVAPPLCSARRARRRLRCSRTFRTTLVAFLVPQATSWCRPCANSCTTERDRCSPVRARPLAVRLPPPTSLRSTTTTRLGSDGPSLIQPKSIAAACASSSYQPLDLDPTDPI
jgi:hypothetical protein